MSTGDSNKKMFLVMVVLSLIICSLYYNRYTNSFVHNHVSSMSQMMDLSNIMKRIAGGTFVDSKEIEPLKSDLKNKTENKIPKPSTTNPKRVSKKPGAIAKSVSKKPGAIAKSVSKKPGVIAKSVSKKPGAIAKSTTRTKTIAQIKTATKTTAPSRIIPPGKSVSSTKPQIKNIAPPKTANKTQIKNVIPTKKVATPKHTSIHQTTSPGPISSPVAKNKKYLIYLCNSGRWCGGWGDRQRGIFTVYLASFAYNRTFGIEMNSPCPLQRFYEPNEVNWLIDPKELVNKTTRVIDAMGQGPPFLGNFTEDVIKLKINSDASYGIRHQFKKLMPEFVKQGSRAIMFRRVWNKLMKPTKLLKKHVQQVAGFMDETKLVCAHVRIGKSVDLPNDPPRVNINTTHKLWTFLKRFENNSKIFIATDNSKVRASARETFGNRYFDTGGRILHIDRQRNDKQACEGFETSLVDQRILSQCDVLVVSPSNFSVRAAMLKKVLNEMYAFGGGEVNPFKPSRRRRSLSSADVFTLSLGHKILTVYVL